MVFERAPQSQVAARFMCPMLYTSSITPGPWPQPLYLCRIQGSYGLLHWCGPYFMLRLVAEFPEHRELETVRLGQT